MEVSDAIIEGEREHRCSARLVGEEGGASQLVSKDTLGTG